MKVKVNKRSTGKTPAAQDASVNIHLNPFGLLFGAVAIVLLVSFFGVIALGIGVVLGLVLAVAWLWDKIAMPLRRAINIRRNQRRCARRYGGKE